LLRWKAEELQKLKAAEQQLRQHIDSYKNMEQSNSALNIEISRLTQELQEHRVTHSRTSQRLEKLQLENAKLSGY
jgi:chromosome segregation ATPase